MQVIAPLVAGALALAGSQALPATTTAANRGVAAPPGCVAPATWSLANLAAQTLVVPVDADSTASVLPEVRAGEGGVILFGSTAPRSIGVALHALAAASPHAVAPLVMADEEGGAVQRLSNLVGPLPSARALGRSDSPAEITALASSVGRRLRSLGVTMDLAPVLDTDGGAGPNDRDPDGTRSFSVDPAIAQRDGIAFAKGLLAGGVVPVVKHFPGLGEATGNSDVVVAATLPWSQLRSGGLRPFAAAIAAGLPALMVSVASVPGLTRLPAALSAGVVAGELRATLHFSGLVLTDSLSAVSVSARGYSLERAAVTALRVGDDMVLYNASASATGRVNAGLIGAIVDAVASGHLSRSRLLAAVGHVLAAKGLALCPSAE